MFEQSFLWCCCEESGEKMFVLFLKRVQNNEHDNNHLGASIKGKWSVKTKSGGLPSLGEWSAPVPNGRV